MPLDALLRPRSIAVVGVSERLPFSRAFFTSAATMGFDGPVYPINPKLAEFEGVTCYPSVADLPTVPDVVAFCVSYTRVLDSFRPLADKGVRAAVIFDGGFAERGADGRRLQSEIEGICREANILLCGPNCMGVLNPVGRSSIYMQDVHDPVRLLGNVGLISQSGSICIGMISDVRRFGFSHVISSGNEAILSTADFIEALVDEPETKVIATFTETIKDPERYVAALDRAADRGKPVVVLKVGRSERSRRAITSHTGGLAGESRVFSEVLRRHRAIEVGDIDELTEVLAACQAERWPKGRRFAVITASGGQAELILDVAAANGIELPPLHPEARQEVERVVGPLTGDGNPLDAWGNGDFNTNLPHTLAVLSARDEIDAIAFCSDGADDQPVGRPNRWQNYSTHFSAAAGRSAKPHFLMSTRPGVINSDQTTYLREQGIAVIAGTRQGLGALDRLARYAVPPPRPMPAAVEGARAGRLDPGGRRTIHEHEAKQHLAQYGIVVTRERLVTSLAEAHDAAQTLGYPVALKAVSDDIPHKTDLGLVALGLGDGSALAAAWERLSRRVAALEPTTRVAGYLVQEMVADGVELFAGVSRDPEFGLVLAFGLGGTEIELKRDFALRPLPLAEGDAEAMLEELKGAALLNGFRGAAPVDRAALARCLYRLSDFAIAEGASLAEIDLNPIKASAAGAIVIDALIVPRQR